MTRTEARERLLAKLNEARGRTLSSLFDEFLKLEIKGITGKCRECAVAVWLDRVCELSPYFARVSPSSLVLLHPQDVVLTQSGCALPDEDDTFLLPRVLQKLVLMFDRNYLPEFDLKPIDKCNLGVPLPERAARFYFNSELVYE